MREERNSLWARVQPRKLPTQGNRLNGATHFRLCGDLSANAQSSPGFRQSASSDILPRRITGLDDGDNEVR